MAVYQLNSDSNFTQKLVLMPSCSYENSDLLTIQYN